MIKYYCDKCGKEIDSFSAFVMTLEVPEVCPWNYPGVFNRETHHFCSDCIVDVAKYMTTKKEAPNEI